MYWENCPDGNIVVLLIGKDQQMEGKLPHKKISGELVGAASEGGEQTDERGETFCREKALLIWFI
jgi:hypothetical protein